MVLLVRSFGTWSVRWGSERAGWTKKLQHCCISFFFGRRLKFPCDPTWSLGNGGNYESEWKVFTNLKKKIIIIKKILSVTEDHVILKCKLHVVLLVISWWTLLGMICWCCWSKTVVFEGGVKMFSLHTVCVFCRCWCRRSCRMCDRVIESERQSHGAVCVCGARAGEGAAQVRDVWAPVRGTSRRAAAERVWAAQPAGHLR